MLFVERAALPVLGRVVLVCLFLVACSKGTDTSAPEENGGKESGAATEPPPPDIPVDKLFKDLTAADIAAWCSWLSALKQARADECSELYEPAFDVRAQCDRAVSFCTYPWSELVRCVSKTHKCLRRDGVDATMPDGASIPSCLTPQGIECGPDIETECNTLVHCGGGPQ